MNDSLIALQPALHPVYGRLLCAEMQSRGFAPEEIMAGTGLDWRRFHEDNRFLSFEQMSRLIRHCMTLADCPWLGIDVGLRTQVASHGALGAAMSASRNVGEAMQVAERYAFFRQYMVIMHWVAEPEPYIEVREQIPLGELREFLLCLLVAGLGQVLSALTGQSLQTLIRIEWPFPEPPWRDQFLRIVTLNSFEHDRLRFYFDAAALATPSLSADAEVLQNALRECELQLSRARVGGVLSQRIRAQLLRCEGTLPTLPEVAASESVSVRTLIRHLQKEKTSFQALLDDARKARVSWLLLQTEYSVDEIASQLGYVDTSNFSRTFRRWFDMTPSEFRRADSPQR